MSEVGKGGEPRTGRAGQARTRLARRAVIGAARDLFVEKGYPAATIEAISERSDVPSATIYRLFSSKLGILKILFDASIASDDQGLALQGWLAVAAAAAAAHPRKLLADFVAISVGINTRSSDIYGILLGAAAADPAAADLLASYTAMRDHGQGTVAATLARAGALRPGMPERDAADIIHAFMSPDLYRLLVIDRGWPPRRYQSWLASVLAGLLLPAG